MKEKTEKKNISKAALARIPLYLHLLQEENAKGRQYISSTVIAQSIAVSSVLVRKDLEIVSSLSGSPRKGFAVSRLLVDMEKFLGFDQLSSAIIVGAGGLGRAFLGYEGFKNNGLNVVAAFDVDTRLIGTVVSGKPIFPMQQLKSFVKEQNIKIGIITVPKHSAQSVLDEMVTAGIKAVWNFAPAHLHAPKDIVLKTEDLATSLAILVGELYKTEESKPIR